MVKQTNELFRDALTLENQTSKKDTYKGLDALFKRLDIERSNSRNPGYSLKDGKKGGTFYWK